MNAKVEIGKQATAAVQEYVQHALEMMQGKDAKINARGVLVRPRDYRDALLAGAQKLNAAAVLIERTKWPSRKDYAEAAQ